MRRYLSLMLVAIFAVALALGVVGCKKDADAPADQPAQEEQQADDAAAQDEAAPAAEEGAAQ
jgi:hypothetical protein